jgi:hypothetical protein
MRILALARYRALRTIRSASPVFALALLAAALPVALPGGAFMPAYISRSLMKPLMFSSAFAVSLTYVVHLLVLLASCGVFGTRRRTAEGQEVLDLTETIPATGSDRFFGDAAGIFGAVLAIHACVLPMLGLAVVLSPLPAAVFFWMEAMTLAVIILASAGAAGNLHAQTKWRQTQLARSLVVFIVLAVVVLKVTTRWQQFADAAWFSVVEPSPNAWSAVGRAITNPPLLLISMFLLYAAFISWFALRSVRFLEQR